MKLATVVCVLCALLGTARADQSETAPALKAVGGIALVHGDNSAYGRLTFRFAERKRATLIAAYLFDTLEEGRDQGTTQFYLEGGVEGRAAPPEGQDMLPEAARSPFYRAWRLGGFLHADVPAVAGSGPAGLFKLYTPSKVGVVYAGYGIGIHGPRMRALLAADLLVAPVVTQGTYRNELGDMVDYEDDDISRFGGRVDFKTEYGPEAYGFCLDIQLGYSPGIDRKGLIVASFLLYVGL